MQIASTQKFNLCSSGTYTDAVYRPSFTLSKVIVLHERLLHLCSVEIVLLKHPTIFHNNYMNGEVSIIAQDGTNPQRKIAQLPDEELFNPC